MAILSICLPPFSPDYSGVSSVLFDLHTVTAMHDASGCTGNYTGYDEPRWYGSQSAIFCSGLREIDAILGDDEKLVKKMIAASKDIHPQLMAMVGSPVPMVIGSDLTGLAVELEERTGIPCLGFDTTGTHYYDCGVSEAQFKILKRFAVPMETVPNTVNILGANPMDFGTGENLAAFKQLLTDAGFTVNLCMSMDYTLEQVKHAACAEINLVVSKSGLRPARFLNERFGIPYLCGLPYGERCAQDYLNTIDEVRRTKVSTILKGQPADQDEILIIGEQVQSNAIRLALEQECGMSNITVGCIFGRDEALALPQDKDLPSERAIREEMKKPCYRTIIADPFMRMVLSEEEQKSFWDCSLYAVSSKLGKGVVPMIGKQFNQWISERR